MFVKLVLTVFRYVWLYELAYYMYTAPSKRRIDYEANAYYI